MDGEQAFDESGSVEVAQFFGLLRRALEKGSLVELVLTAYRGDEADLTRVIVRRIAIKEGERLSFVYRYASKDITKNLPIADGVEKIRGLLGHTFMNAHLFSATENVQIEFGKKGKCRLSTSKPSRTVGPSADHNREKRHLVDPTRPYLNALGVTDAQHEVVPSMARKWKQINKFVEIFQHAVTSSKLSAKPRIHVLDFGSGKGYLTFAAYDFLRNVLGVETHVTGIELREDLVNLCTDVATRLSMDGLQFRQGAVGSYAPETIHALIALHACDTATDLAIHLGIRSEAEIVMCAPCCHKEIRRQIKSPQVLRPMLKYGVHLGQEADMVTDSLRALLLEAHGYRTRILEFVSLEHTSKNKMILAIRHAAPDKRDALLAQIAAIKAFYGIKEQRLESLLAAESGPATPGRP